MQASTSWDDVAFSSTERDRHLGIRPVSQLDTWPMVSPVNASRRPSRDAAHHSGSGWLVRPSPWGTCTSYSWPAFLAHSEPGQKRGSRSEERFNPLRGMCLRRRLTHLRSGTGCTSGLPRDRRLPTNLANASLHAYLGNVVESKRKQCPESNPCAMALALCC